MKDIFEISRGKCLGHCKKLKNGRKTNKLFKWTAFV